VEREDFFVDRGYFPAERDFFVEREDACRKTVFLQKKTIFL
jgi:hypothetical protein